MKLLTHLNCNAEAIKVLYNRSRVANILMRFQERVNSSRYPVLPSLPNTNFKLLKNERELNIIKKYITKFPLMINSFDAKRVGKIIPKLWQFLLFLSQDYSTYYGEIRILCVSYRLFSFKSINKFLIIFRSYTYQGWTYQILPNNVRQNMDAEMYFINLWWCISIVKLEISRICLIYKASSWGLAEALLRLKGEHLELLVLNLLNASSTSLTCNGWTAFDHDC